MKQPYFPGSEVSAPNPHPAQSRDRTPGQRGPTLARSRSLMRSGPLVPFHGYARHGDSLFSVELRAVESCQ